MDKWNELLNMVSDEQYEYMSFDIFDTLLLRPFWSPSDLFYFVGIYAKKNGLVKKEIDFINLRKKAEVKARFNKKDIYQDVTLDEIYDNFSKLIKINQDLDLIKQQEIFYEKYFCYRRNSGYDLYKKALECKKKLICISDMYLDKTTINEMLCQNGFEQFNKVYVSSEIKVGKYTGDLFHYVSKDLNIENDKILHIGDNYESDYVMAKKCGYNAVHLTNTKDIHQKEIIIKKNMLLYDRIMYALEANEIWDNPFIKSRENNIFDKYNKIFHDFHNQIKNEKNKICDKNETSIFLRGKRYLQRCVLGKMR